jgi:hypothetical protein
LKNKSIHNSEYFSILKNKKEKPILSIENKDNIHIKKNNIDKLALYTSKLQIENKENINFIPERKSILKHSNLKLSFKQENELSGNKSIRYEDQEENDNDNDNNVNSIKLNIIKDKKNENKPQNNLNKSTKNNEKKINISIYKKKIALNKSMKTPSNNIKKMIKILEEERKRIKIENKYQLTDPIKKDENEEFYNNVEIIKRANTFIVPQVERLIEMKPKINYKRKKPKNLQFGNNDILLSESMDISNQIHKDNLQKKAILFRNQLKANKKK